jgi:uncharacterized protein (TIGR02284 family)
MAAEERDPHSDPLRNEPSEHPVLASTAASKASDRKDLVDVLNDLVACCKDGEHGFKYCAEHAQREDLRAAFMQCALDCTRGAQELNDEIQSLGGEVRDSGSALGAVHRGWVSVKLALSTHDDKVLLSEAERGEDDASNRYRKALEKPLPVSIRSLVERQLHAVQRHHDQMKVLRQQISIAR